MLDFHSYISKICFQAVLKRNTNRPEANSNNFIRNISIFFFFEIFTIFHYWSFFLKRSKIKLFCCFLCVLWVKGIQNTKIAKKSKSCRRIPDLNIFSHSSPLSPHLGSPLAVAPPSLVAFKWVVVVKVAFTAGVRFWVRVGSNRLSWRPRRSRAFNPGEALLLSWFMVWYRWLGKFSSKKREVF